MQKHSNSLMATFIMADKIIRLEDVINQTKVNNTEKEKNVVSSVKKKSRADIPRGAPKSGRFWKGEKNKFSSIIKTRGLKRSNKFEKLQKLKEDLKRVRTITKSLVNERNEQIEEKKQRRRDNIKRQEENRLKSEIVQVIKNSAKIKRMKKKQLRSIEKRDTLSVR